MVPVMTDWYTVVEDVLVACYREEYYKRNLTKEEVLTAAEAAESEQMLQQAVWWSVITLLANANKTAKEVLEGNRSAGNLVNLIYADEWSVMTAAWLKHYQEAV